MIKAKHRPDIELIKLWYLIGNDELFMENLLCHMIYRKISNIRRILAGDKIVYDSDVVGALLQLHLHSWLNTWLQ